MQIKTQVFFHISLKNSMIALGIMVLACLVCTPLHIIGDSDSHVPLIFILAILFISRFTDGYFYGIIASVLSLFCVNYIFTYPYFAFNFTITGYPLTFLSMLVVSVITSAMTSQIKQQEKIRIEAEREKMRANLLRAISHDLRTPLTSITGAITAVIESGDGLDAGKRSELLYEARDDAQWLIRMVENLLSITRIDSESHIEKEPEAIEEILSESVLKFKKQFPDIKVSVSVPDELLLVPIDAMLIEQVVMNLLYNSAMHGKHTTEIVITTKSDGENAVFSIKDDGAGFSEERLADAFCGYLPSPEKNASADSRRNMGIGLSVCMSIISAHGGKMTANNSPEGGAVLNFTLPLEDK